MEFAKTNYFLNIVKKKLRVFHQYLNFLQINLKNDLVDVIKTTVKPYIIHHSKSLYFQKYQITDLPIGKSVMGSITDRLPISVIMETLIVTFQKSSICPNKLLETSELFGKFHFYSPNFQKISALESNLVINSQKFCVVILIV
jgi:hypothetical protein